MIGTLRKVRLQRGGYAFIVSNKDVAKTFWTDNPLDMSILDRSISHVTKLGVEYNERNDNVKSVWEEYLR